MTTTAHLVWYAVACAVFLPASLSNSDSETFLCQFASALFSSVSESSKLLSFILSDKVTTFSTSNFSSSFKSSSIFSPESSIIPWIMSKDTRSDAAYAILPGCLPHPTKPGGLFAALNKTHWTSAAGIVWKKSPHLENLVWRNRNRIIVL